MIRFLRSLGVGHAKHFWTPEEQTDGFRKKATSKRELIEPSKGDKRYVRRKADGTFGKTVDVGKSLVIDREHTAKTKVPKGQGDRGDVKK